MEHLRFSLKLLILAFFALILASCQKRDPNPENKDPVYAQLQTDLGVAKAALTLVDEHIKTNKDSLATAVPQAGEYAVFEKRLNQGLDARLYASQQVRMYEVRIEERKVYVQKRYLESLTKDGRKWPDPEESEGELQKLRLLREKQARIKDTLNKEEKK